MAKFGLECKEWPGLVKMIEESAELGQIAAKIIAFDGQIIHPTGFDMKAHLEDEIGDVIAAISFAIDNGTLNEEKINERVKKKYEFFQKIYDNGGVIP